MERKRKISRQVVGYDCFVEKLAYQQLTELYRALRLYVNFFQHSMKLLSKERERKKVRCVYDPAKTPLQQLLATKNTAYTSIVRENMRPMPGLLPLLDHLTSSAYRLAVDTSASVADIEEILAGLGHNIATCFWYLKASVS